MTSRESYSHPVFVAPSIDTTMAETMRMFAGDKKVTQVSEDVYQIDDGPERYAFGLYPKYEFSDSRFGIYRDYDEEK